MSLFRTEVLDHRAQRLHGEVSLAVPLAWHVIGLAFLAFLIAGLLFLALATYSRVETVSGTIVLDRGVASVVPSRRGIVLAVRARDGEIVRAGAPLVIIGADETLTSGRTTARRLLEAIRRQDIGLASQSAQLMSAAAAEQARLAALASGIRQELVSLDRQIAVQRELVASATREVELVQDIARRGYISRREVLAREETVLTRRQHLAELDRLRAAKLAALAETQGAIERVRAEASAQSAQFASSRAELEQRQVNAQAGEGYVLTAPVSGLVTAVTARPGQAVDGEQALMTVVPSNASPLAELRVPTSAAGFLAVGQEVRLAIDAFPYQRFGTVPARITQISATTISHHVATGATVPVYLVTAELRRPWVMAFGRRQPLLPGMTLSARIVTERQSLLQWLFQPVFAVRNR